MPERRTRLAVGGGRGRVDRRGTMKYRSFGRLAWESSILGMGVMRLPGLGEDGQGAIDESESVRIIRSGIDRGVNYVDLGFPWDMSRHEPIIAVVRDALAGGYRERVKSRAHDPCVLDLVAHGLRSLPGQTARMARVRQRGLLPSRPADIGTIGLSWRGWASSTVLRRRRRTGASARAGFSFHDHYQVLKSIVQAYDRWVLCSFQYSYMDVNHDPGATGIRYAADSGLAVVVTEPLKGGRLTERASRRRPPGLGPVRPGVGLSRDGACASSGITRGFRSRSAT